ncbi:hypothetical protein [Halosegnis marinus]|uniref:DUF7993 domain-containing protein n=1 Tax=Halosegnis marinus TaxID=3034023 RepID=A0ABD5ZL44_9EURY|nr:hypothetical protein [Halosegnis sp. DT85]
MVEDRTTDGRRLAELLSSEIHGRDSGPLGRLSVADADPDVEPDEFGAYAYAVALDGERVAEVAVHPDRIHAAFAHGVEAAVAAGGDAGLRVRPKAVEPPRTLVFAEDGAEVKRLTDVFVAVVESLDAPE